MRAPTPRRRVNVRRMRKFTLLRERARLWPNKEPSLTNLTGEKIGNLGGMAMTRSIVGKNSA